MSETNSHGCKVYYYHKFLPAMRQAIRHSLDSNDPDSKVGVVFVCEEKDDELVSGGYNLIVLDSYEPQDKLLAAAHAEKMAIQRVRDAGWANLSRLTMVVTRHPCSQCMIDIWLSGCKRVVYLDRDPPTSKWARSFEVAKAIAAKFEILLVGVPFEAINSEAPNLPAVPRAG